MLTLLPTITSQSKKKEKEKRKKERKTKKGKKQKKESERRNAGMNSCGIDKNMGLNSFHDWNELLWD